MEGDGSGGAVDGDNLVVLEDGGSGFGRDDGWDAEFSGSDRCVREECAAFGDDSRGPCERGCPGWRGERRDDDVTGLNPINLVWPANYPHWSSDGSGAGADTA